MGRAGIGGHGKITPVAESNAVSDRGTAGVHLVIARRLTWWGGPAAKNPKERVEQPLRTHIGRCSQHNSTDEPEQDYAARKVIFRPRHLNTGELPDCFPRLSPARVRAIRELMPPEENSCTGIKAAAE